MRRARARARLACEFGCCADSPWSFRASVIIDQERGIIGIGDDKVRKEAEKLAALDALFQLARAGLVSGLPGGCSSILCH